MSSPRVGIIGLTGCSGCQLAILNCETELPAMVRLLEFPLFPFAVSGDDAGPLDAVLIEGAVSSQEEVEMLSSLRARSRLLIALGTCAAWGGMAAIASDKPRDMLVRQVYGRKMRNGQFHPQPLSRHVKVDFTLTGCPPEKDEIIAALAGLLHGVFPVFPPRPVCADCRAAENRCLLTADGALCMGPLTQGGCSARCPSRLIPCEGCRGPVDEANADGELSILLEKGQAWEAVERRMGRFHRGGRRGTDD